MAEKTTNPDADDTPQDGEPEEQDDSATSAERAEDDDSWFDGKPFTAKAAKELVTSLRAEIKGFKKVQRELAEAKDKLKKIDDEKLSDVERLQRQVDELQKERDEMAAKVRTRELEAALRGAGVIYPDLAVSKLSDEALEDEDVLAREVGELKKSYPSLFSTNGSADGAEGGKPVNKATDMNKRILQAIRQR